MDDTKQIIWGFSNRPAKLEHVIQSCGTGWESLISKLIIDLFNAGWNGTLFQVKEKFGTLRFYIGQGNDEIYNLISKAEKASAKTCIDCGEEGERYYDGWILPLCETHAKKRGREKY